MAGCGSLPEWLSIRYDAKADSGGVSSLVNSLSLHTVCQSAHCPNRNECWAKGTASFMVMGEYCTRACRFCSVKTLKHPPPPDPLEPERLAEAVSSLSLKYVVITSVTRDDLAYGGAGHIASCINEIRSRSPGTIIEALVPDFNADPTAVGIVVSARPEVVSHNIETIERLTPSVRDRRAGYWQSIDTLALFRELSGGRIITKSGLMVGLGETDDEVLKAMYDLRRAGVEMLTIGQYLQPAKTPRHVPVREFIIPARFWAYSKAGYDAGFRHVASDPFVRSSYLAAEPFIRGTLSPRR